MAELASSAQAEGKNNKKKRPTGFPFQHELSVLIGLVVLGGIFSLLSDRFLTLNNLISVANQVSMVFIISVGMTIVIILAGMDLSVGSVAGLAGMITAGFLSAGHGLLVAILAGLLIGAAVGFFNGLVITKVGITDFIVTLATMSIAHGLIFAYTGGYPIYQNIPESFLLLGQGYIGFVPVPVILALLAFFAGHFLLSRCRLGTYIYAVGGNREAARLSGINVSRIRLLGYVISGVLAAFAGIIMTSRLGSGQPTAGDTFLFDAIGAPVLGGTSLMGGEGTMLGTVIGVAIIGIISNGLTLLNVPFFYQEVIKGLIIVLAVAYNSFKSMRNR
jgi:ribose transport system permease protein